MFSLPVKLQQLLRAESKLLGDEKTISQSDKNQRK